MLPEKKGHEKREPYNPENLIIVVILVYPITAASQKMYSAAAAAAVFCHQHVDSRQR